MKTIEQLKAEQRQISEALTVENYPATKKRLSEIDAQIHEINIKHLVSEFNRKYARLREIAALAWEAEQPTEDITTNDGSFHKVKVKKYPKLAAIQYCYGVWEDGRLTELRINGEKFSMYKRAYEYNKPTVYIRPDSFDEFLGLNNIPKKDITVEEYNTLAAEAKRLKSVLDEHIAAYKKGLDDIHAHSFNYWGLLEQRNEYLYTYLPKY